MLEVAIVHLMYGTSAAQDASIGSSRVTFGIAQTGVQPGFDGSRSGDITGSVIGSANLLADQFAGHPRLKAQ
jgi:hypothetical protein